MHQSVISQISSSKLINVLSACFAYEILILSLKKQTCILIQRDNLSLKMHNFLCQHFCQQNGDHPSCCRIANAHFVDQFVFPPQLWGMKNVINPLCTCFIANKLGETWGATYSKGPQVGFESREAAARTQPHIMGRTLYLS